MKLYGFPPSGNTWKVRATACHLNEPLDFEIVDITRAPTAEYLALNPTGRVPTLVDGDFALWESTAIMQYLAERAASPLWPKEVRTRADIMRWQSWGLAHWAKDACQPLTFERFVKKFTNRGAPDAAIVANALTAFHRDAPVLERHFAGHSYLVGDALTLADFSIAASLLYAKEAEMPLVQYPRLREWHDRVMALPAWREASPQARAATATTAAAAAG
jgi:glutathione S-transferase